MQQLWGGQEGGLRTTVNELYKSRYLDLDRAQLAKFFKDLPQDQHIVFLFHSLKTRIRNGPMKFADDAKVAGIMNMEENPNFVQQLMTSSKTTLRPSFEVLYEKHFRH